MTPRTPLSVWITRTRPGAEETAARVEAAGFRAIVAPLLDVLSLDVPEMGAGDVIFTSANGVRTFRGDRTRTAWCVGEATADTARAAGFADARIGPGDVAGLTKMMAQGLAGPAVHWSGAHVRGNLVGDLTRAGHDVARVVAYRAVAVGAAPVAAADIVMVHSPRAAEVYAKLADGVARASVAISAAADAPLATDPALVRYVAETPDPGGMLAALGRAACEMEGNRWKRSRS